VTVTASPAAEQIMSGSGWVPAVLELFTGDTGGGGGGGSFTVTVTPEPAAAPPRIRIDIVDTRPAPITSLTVSRLNPDGHSQPARTSDGGPLPLFGGAATVYDYEPPYDQPITYSTDVAGGPTAVTELDVPDAWLIHVGVPARSCRITVTSLPSRTRTSNTGLHKVLGSQYPVPISSGARQAASGVMGLRTYTDADRQALDLLLDDDSVLLLNIPPAKGWGWDACYVSCGDLVETRTVNWGPFPYREWQLPLQVVGRPGGGTQAAITWNTIADQYPTWQSIIDAGVTSWADLANPTT
jgi:hypothetical protein